MQVTREFKSLNNLSMKREENHGKRPSIKLRHIVLRHILPTNWLRFFVYSTNLVCKMNNCIIPLTI